MDYSEMVAATAKAIGKRNDLRDKLAARIEAVAEKTVAVLGAVEGPGFAIRMERVSGACRQGEGWPTTTGTERDLIVWWDTIPYSFGDIDVSFFDGHNCQNQFGKTMCRGRVVKPATVAILREIAASLPAAITEAHERQRAKMEEESTAAQQSLDAGI